MVVPSRFLMRLIFAIGMMQFVVFAPLAPASICDRAWSFVSRILFSRVTPRELEVMARYKMQHANSINAALEGREVIFKERALGWAKVVRKIIAKQRPLTAPIELYRGDAASGQEALGATVSFRKFLSTSKSLHTARQFPIVELEAGETKRIITLHIPAGARVFDFKTLYSRIDELPSEFQFGIKFNHYREEEEVLLHTDAQFEVTESRIVDEGWRQVIHETWTLVNDGINDLR